jgi:hypothetical protein
VNWSIYKYEGKPANLMTDMEFMSACLQDGLKHFIKKFKPEENAGEAWLQEFPSTEEAGCPFTNVRYRFSFGTSLAGLKLGKIPYNIKIERADFQSYWADFPEKAFPKDWGRTRRIKNVPAIK